MTFDYKAMNARLRQSFSTAAEAKDVLPRLNFEEIISDRNGGPSFGLRVAEKLETLVPGLSPAVLAVALVAGLPTSMMRDSGRINEMSPAVRALYIESRDNKGFFGHGVSPELCQVAIATSLVNMELLAEARQKQYVPYAEVMRLSQNVNMILHALPATGVGAPALEKNFRDAAAALQQEARDFFSAPKPAVPKTP